ncbi:DUF6355 family natural product biosynthesis protein [Streptomyces olivoreticuli]
MTVKRAASAVISAGLLVLCISPAAFAAAPAENGHPSCGFYTKDFDAYYNHCSDDNMPTRIEVEVGQVRYEMCARIGKNWLGNKYNISWARDTGHPCSLSPNREDSTAPRHPQDPEDWPAPAKHPRKTYRPGTGR